MNSRTTARKNEAQEVETTTQALQTKGVEAQAKIEQAISLALSKYNLAIENVRRNFFKKFHPLKRKIKKARETSNKEREKELEKLKKIFNDTFSMRKLQSNIFQITSKNDFPLKTRHYIPKASSIRVDVSLKYNLFNLCAFQEINKKLTKQEIEALTRQKGAEKDISELFQHQVNFICQFLVKNVSEQYITMVILARLMEKPPVSFLKYWLKATKHSVKKLPKKIFAYKNAQYFCTMCRKYVCNQHYEDIGENSSQIVDTEPDFEYSPYVTRFQMAYSKEKDEESKNNPKKKGKEEENFNLSYHLLYKCPEKNQTSCYLANKTQTELQKFEVQSFEEYQKEFILNYCLKYGIINPCAISLMLKCEKKCWEIDLFLQHFPSSPRNTLPDELINKAKANKTLENPQLKKKKEPMSNTWKHYFPCYHPGAPCEENCACVEFGSCEFFCGCAKDCSLRAPGCNCKPGKCSESSSCWCVKNNRECDPETCWSCNSEINLRLAKKRSEKSFGCPNTNLLYKCKARLLLGKSGICDGMGIFAGQRFDKGDFIGEYVGEMIRYYEGDVRGILYNELGCSYMFDNDEESILDAYFYGNKLRYVNHGSGGKENAETKYCLVKGSVRIGLYALKEIKIGEEILFNYGENYQLDWIVEYNGRVRQEKKEEENRKRRERRKKKREQINLFKEMKEGKEVIFSDLEDN